MAGEVTVTNVTIVHSLSNRVHLAAPQLAWHREACARVARALADDGAFDRVTVRPATGSVIVENEGDERPLSAAALQAKLVELASAERDDEGRLLTELGPEDHPGSTRIARAVVRAAAGINADVRAALDDRADLGTVLPVIFALGGIAEVGATGRMPVPTWFNLLWWSLRSFMTFNIRAVEEEVSAGEEPTSGQAHELHEIVKALWSDPPSRISRTALP